MKKISGIFSLLVIMLLFSGVCNAYQPKSSDFVIINEPEKTQSTDNSIELIPLNSKNNIEYKYKLNNKTGYINKQTQVNFITDFDDISLIDKYLKVKQKGKFGLIDKKGNIILAPVFQKISILTFEDKEYIAAKADGKYRLYYNTGNLFPENKLYNVVQNTSIMLAKDLKPLFKAAVINNKITYSKIENKKDSKKLVYEVNEIEIPSNIQIAHIEKNVINNDDKKEIPQELSKQLTFSDKDNNLFTIKNKKFYIKKEGKNIGIMNEDKEIIIPAKYDSFVVQKPCKHLINPVFILKRNGALCVYDIKGKMIAEQVYDKINIYRNGNIHTFYVENNVGILTENGDEIGRFTKSGSDYKYTPTKFKIFKPHIVNNILLTMLNYTNL